MKLALSLSILLGASSLFANQSLITKAKNAGLEPIPSSKDALMKLIDDKKDPITAAKVELGKKLYFDPRLSRSNLISCNTCHNLALGGADGVPAAIGHGWTANPHHLNSPTVYNSVFFKAQFWDGRSPHLADQAQGPVQAGPEMAAPPSLVEERINSIPEYVNEFKTTYGKDVKIDFGKITSTIATFEKTLVTPSRFDKFLEGDSKALTKEEQEGLDIFLNKGCTACHTGIAIGGTMQPFQIANQYTFTNVGDFKGDENGMVKTPTLRNIAETAPYFHNGQIWALTDAIKEMGSVQLGIEISDGDAAKIETFLKVLSGTKPNITYPQLPASTNKTPKPSFD
ncbi:periplasmic diheme cytochrome c peroxidase [Aliarcobacter faecis]|uniref:cytochrome-c peroxidase n=1 Tax=Aliarcobacter faecis TaxID=1564138 RepID=UPI00047ED172|nr:cytochrome-c peroxidase [Aliarcobacter faecis]QKF72434.1 periplasmic diheme cytochrome c peroxidase [Aliarcobacter faecis]